MGSQSIKSNSNLYQHRRMRRKRSRQNLRGITDISWTNEAWHQIRSFATVCRGLSLQLSSGICPLKPYFRLYVLYFRPFSYSCFLPVFSLRSSRFSSSLEDTLWWSQGNWLGIFGMLRFRHFRHAFFNKFKIHNACTIKRTPPPPNTKKIKYVQYNETKTDWILGVLGYFHILMFSVI